MLKTLPPLQVRRRLGLLVAVEEEASLLLRDLRLKKLPSQGDCRVYGGVHGRASLTLVISGAGPRRAEQGARILREGFDPEVYVSVGLAGGLVADLRVGDCVLADEVVELEGRRWLADLSWLERSDLAFDRVGRVLTVPRVLVEPAEKRALGERSEALVVDMETSSLAEVARQAGRPWVALRAVSDPLEEELPLDFNRFWDDRGQPSLGRIVLATLRRPQRIPGLLRFSREVLAARRKMCRLLHSMIEAL